MSDDAVTAECEPGVSSSVNAVEALRAALLRTLRSTITDRKLSQSEAARLIGVDQPTLSKALGGRLTSLSIDRLVGWLDRLGVPVALAAADDLTSRALHASEGRLRLIQETSGVCLWERDLVTGEDYWSDGAYVLYGRARDLPPPSYEEWLDLLHPDDREKARAPRRVLLADGEVYENELRVVRPDGEIRWMLNRGRADVDAAGNPIRFYGVNVDISERKRAEERLGVLLGELSHRAKNTIAVVSAIAQQTFRSEPISPTARAAFEGRLSALAAANDLLVRGDWQATPLSEVIATAIRPHQSATEDQRFEIEGPDITVPPRAAIALALVLHELCTNGVKYGALSNDTGRVEITWTARVEGLSTHLRIIWRETGGPAVTVPTRQGFGSRLIQRILAADLGAKAEVLYEPGGIVCAIEGAISAARHDNHSVRGLEASQPCR